MRVSRTADRWEASVYPEREVGYPLDLDIDGSGSNLPFKKWLFMAVLPQSMDVGSRYERVPSVSCTDGGM